MAKSNNSPAVMDPPGEIVAPQPPAPPGPIDPLALVQAAIERGMGADELDKLVTLAQRMSAFNSESAFNEAMNRAQGRMPAVARNKMNAHTKKAYADLAAICSAIKPVYTEEGLALSFTEEPGAADGLVRVVCEVRHTGGFVKKYQGDFPLEGQGMKGGANMTPMQGRGSSLAYARRYISLLVFNITIVDEDNDGAPAGGFINEAQAQVITNLLDQCEKAGRPVNLARFLEWVGPDVPGVKSIPLAQFGRAQWELNRKLSEGKK